MGGSKKWQYKLPNALCQKLVFDNQRFENKYSVDYSFKRTNTETAAMIEWAGYDNIEIAAAMKEAIFNDIEIAGGMKWADHDITGIAAVMKEATSNNTEIAAGISGQASTI